MKYFSMRNKLILSFVFCSITLMVLFGIYFTASQKQFHKKHLKEEMVRIGSISQQRLIHFVSCLEDSLNTFSKNRDIIATLKHSAVGLEESDEYIRSFHIMQNFQNVFDEKGKMHHFFLASKSGEIILSPHIKGQDSSHLGYAISHLPVFKKALKEPVFASFFGFSEASHFHPLLLYPVLDENKSSLGVLVIEVSIPYINSIISEIDYGMHGNFYISTLKGVKVVNDKKNRIPALIRKGFTPALKHGTSITEDVNESGSAFFGYYLHNKKYPWILSIEVDKNVLKSAITESGVSILVVLFCFSLVGLIIAIVMAIIVAKRFVRPINFAVEVANKMADGDFSAKINSDATDEIGQLLRAMKKMLKTLNTAMEAISISSEEIFGGSCQIKSSSESVSQGASDQAASLEETSSAMEEYASQTQSNVDNAVRANKLAEKSIETAQNGDHQMQTLLDSMNEINSAAENVTNVSRAIEEIAFQTNVLAINAAVEAARAGIHGKGFAVVAKEVRNLAQRSSKAAKETTRMIQGAITKIDAGVQVANDTATHLVEIFESSSLVAGIVSEISMAGEQQLLGVSEIVTAINQLNEITQSNAQLSEEFSACSTLLNSQAESLNAVISQFTIRKKKIIRPSKRKKRLNKPNSDKIIVPQISHKPSGPGIDARKDFAEF